MITICELFQKYEAAAQASYDPSLITEAHVLALANEAQLCEENKQYIKAFLDEADEMVLRFIWRFYHFLFCTDEDFSADIWQLDTIQMPESIETKYPGCIKSVVYLLAADHLRVWQQSRGLPAAMIDEYYGRYRGVVRLNLINPETYGLCRLSPFLYGYAKPFILGVGRLNFQLIGYKDYCEMYEDAQGNRLFAALPNYGYNAEGLRGDAGAKPQYQKTQDTLLAHVFDAAGRLKLQAEEIDLKKWMLVLHPGDAVWTIHIPGGRKLNTDEVLQSIADAAKLFEQHFPPYKAFVCHTWFIDPGLRDEIIRKGSNMAAFADLFDVISGPDNENHSIYEHVFQVKKQPLENLVPQNDFQARILKRALEGKKIYWSYGVLKKDVAARVLRPEAKS